MLRGQRSTKFILMHTSKNLIIMHACMLSKQFLLLLGNNFNNIATNILYWQQNFYPYQDNLTD